jgi:hypothetical protein
VKLYHDEDFMSKLIKSGITLKIDVCNACPYLKEAVIRSYTEYDGYMCKLTGSVAQVRQEDYDLCCGNKYRIMDDCPLLDADE